MKTALVLPTNRPEQAIEFLKAWSPKPWDATIIVADTDDSRAWDELIGMAIEHEADVYDWSDYDSCADSACIFSREDSACRSFGFLKAAQQGAEVILTLDDDCRPHGSPLDWVQRHCQNLTSVPVWTSSVPGLHPRGMPYGYYAKPFQVGVSMGLWYNHPDLDGPSRLTRSNKSDDYVPPHGVRVMSTDQFFPLCGMNLAFRREVLCAMYFPPMGRGVPYNRFDDIWGGLVAQKVLHHTGYRFTVGEPSIHHHCQSNPFVALRREASGIEANEWVWRVIDRVQLSSINVGECVNQVAEHLIGHAADTNDPDYIKTWGEYLFRWQKLAEAALAPHC